MTLPPPKTTGQVRAQAQTAFRAGPVAIQIRRRSVGIGTLIAAAILLAAVLALRLGSYELSTAQIWQALSGHAPAIEDMIVTQNRLPRILVAIGAGAAFGLSGAMFQTLLRNPIASPDVIGFNAGASCGAVASLLLSGSMALVLPAALLGGLATAALVLALAYDRRSGGQLDPYRLILCGIGVSLSLGASGDLLLSLTDETRAAAMAQWLTGTLNARTPGDAALVWGGLVVLAPAVIALQFPLANLALSEDIARGLGLNLARLRIAVTVTGVALCALAVSVAGPLPFVAFVAGPVARGILRTARPALFAAALVGAAVVLLADTIARMIPVYTLPAGVFTAVIGAPVLMWLLLAHFRKGTV